MADLAAIRKGIAANLAVIPDVQWSAYMLASPTPPSGHVKTGASSYDKAMQRGLDVIEMKVQLFVALVIDVATQVTLDQYIAGSGALSVKQAIETRDGPQGQVTFGGAASGAWVPSATEPSLYRSPTGESMLVVEWTVSVYAEG